MEPRRRSTSVSVYGRVTVGASAMAQSFRIQK
jgi:hypothetical protein